MGHLYQGGIWIRKQSVIAAAQSPIKTVADLKAAAPNGIDYTRSTDDGVLIYGNKTITPGKPSNLNDYFYLPALGYYQSRVFCDRETGFYWSSTPFPELQNIAYGLYFLSNRMGVNYGSRYFAFRLWSAQ